MLQTTLEAENKLLNTQLDVAKSSIKSRDAELVSKSKELEELQKKLEASDATMASALSEFGGHQERFNEEKKVLDARIQALEVEVAGNKRVVDLYSAISTRFVDPLTSEPHRCPVMQNNGVIRSIGGIIDIWLRESNMGQSNAFRMFQCPVLRNFTMIAPFSIVDTVLKLAGSSGVDVSLPLMFCFRGVDGSWVEFSFNEQLELIARLCDVYSQRKNAERPPEQRSVSVGGMSFLISMCVRGDRLECFGRNNNGGGRVGIKLTFDSNWSHPFVDMDFSSDA